MTSNDKHSPAFPTTGPDHGYYGTGMSLRDYFAAKAMQGILTDPNVAMGDYDNPATARAAYAMADAMLEARK